MINYISYLFLIISSYSTSKVFYLTQKDFQKGPYVINCGGTYRFLENIEFNPPEVDADAIRKNNNFQLGYFAAIIIQARKVVLDLNGYEIKQSPSFYLKQRFYSHIELGSAPFVPRTGPHDFDNTFLKAQNIVIKNGTLGLSAHHGIHGNFATNVTIRNLTIKDFEVGGISINGGNNIYVKDVIVRDNSDKVFVNGGFSAGRQLIGFLHTLKAASEYCEGGYEPYLTVNKKDIKVSKILNELQNLLEETEYHFLHNEFDQIDEFIKNKSIWSDGGVLYGIVFHQERVAVGPFNQDFTSNFRSSNIILENVIIENLILNTTERVALQIDGETKTSLFNRGQMDVVGATFDILLYTNNNGKYRSNPIGNAQLIISKYKTCLFENKDKLREMGYPWANTRRDFISEDILEWAGYGTQFERKYICNCDQMMHSMKGLIPLRFAGLSDVQVTNVEITNSINQTPFGSTLCGQYRDGFSFQNTITGFQGAEIRGISVESSYNINFQNVKVKNLKSLSGSVVGVDVMFTNEEINGEVYVQNLITLQEKDLPNNFLKEIPQKIPSSQEIVLSNNTKGDLKLSNKDCFHLKDIMVGSTF